MRIAEGTWVCQIEDVSQDFEGADSVVVFRPRGSSGTFRSGMFFFSEYVEKSVGREAHISFWAQSATVKKTTQVSKEMTQVGDFDIVAIGELIGFDEGDAIISSSFNLELRVIEKSDYRDLKIGDWVVVEGELRCHWDEGDIIATES